MCSQLMWLASEANGQAAPLEEADEADEADAVMGALCNSLQRALDTNEVVGFEFKNCCQLSRRSIFFPPDTGIGPISFLLCALIQSYAIRVMMLQSPGTPVVDVSSSNSAQMVEIRCVILLPF